MILFQILHISGYLFKIKSKLVINTAVKCCSMSQLFYVFKAVHEVYSFEGWFKSYPGLSVYPVSPQSPNCFSDKLGRYDFELVFYL